MAWGDVDGDGDLDLAVGNYSEPNRVYLNRTSWTGAGLVLSGEWPSKEGAANFLSASRISIGPTLPVTYTLFDKDRKRVNRIDLHYSLNGGGQWLPALATTETITMNLASYSFRQVDKLFLPMIAKASVDFSPNPPDQPAAVGTSDNPFLSPASHLYTWDLSKSGFFGQSDNVVLRMTAYAQPLSTTVGITGTYRYTNALPGPYDSRPFASVTTFPFRVRGSQVRVISDTVPVPGVIVYRLPVGQNRGALPLAPQREGVDTLESMPYRTNGSGYLGGYGRMESGDTLFAMRPVSLPLTLSDAMSDTARLYHTNITPTPNGVDGFVVEGYGYSRSRFLGRILFYSSILASLWSGMPVQTPPSWIDSALIWPTFPSSCSI